ncbi:MAG TPA: hypothetical protein VIM98_02620 [Dyella sp.]|uniref:hypothetical protein n=1 Tax=Dyella sp. TaxID=1869338 RepID=UPI002F93F08A
MTKEGTFRFVMVGMLAIFFAGLMFSPLMSMTPAGRRVIRFVEKDQILALKVGEIDSIKINRFVWRKESGDGYYVNEYSVHVKGSLGEERVFLAEKCQEGGGDCGELAMR